MSSGDISPTAINSGNAVVRALVHSPLVAAMLYLVVAGGLIATTGIAVVAVLDHQRALARTSELLDQLEGRHRRRSASASEGRPGSPFLEGPTVTVAGAALLQRVASAVSNVGGTIQSSQVDVLGIEAKDGFVGLIVSCEMEQPALQKLLYDLEVGLPFLFVNQLEVQVPHATANDESGGGRIRVLIGLSGQWQGSN
jgi:general secretion pathway protein M